MHILKSGLQWFDFQREWPRFMLAYDHVIGKIIAIYKERIFSNWAIDDKTG